MSDASLPASYFEAKYAIDTDPWRFATSDYEARKYAATLAALPARRFARALEAGCSIGILTASLAQRCDALLAFDFAPAALSQARARIRLPHVAIEQRTLPHDWPDGGFDLIVFSEILYYLGRQDLASVAARTREALLPGGTVVLVHWLGPTDYPLSGDEASALFIEALRGTADLARSAREPQYRLDVLHKPSRAPDQRLWHSASAGVTTGQRATPKGGRVSAEHHKHAAHHHASAARHHEEAAKHHEAGTHDKVAEHAHIAHGHAAHAAHHATEAAKQHADEHAHK